MNNEKCAFGKRSSPGVSIISGVGWKSTDPVIALNRAARDALVSKPKKAAGITIVKMQDNGLSWVVLLEKIGSLRLGRAE